jgi:predicted acyl esterase
MYGFSYAGATQLLAAVGQPPGLATITPAMTGADYYDGWTYRGGALHHAFVLGWAFALAQPTARRRGDYALCGVGALASGDGVALSFVGMGAVPQRHDGDVAAAVARLDPEDDLHATAAYRRRLAEQLAARVIARVREAA